jgi:hypothetical protein
MKVRNLNATEMWYFCGSHNGEGFYHSKVGDDEQRGDGTNKKKPAHPSISPAALSILESVPHEILGT